MRLRDVAATARKGVDLLHGQMASSPSSLVKSSPAYEGPIGAPFQRDGRTAVIERRIGASVAESSKRTVSPCIATPSPRQSSSRSTFTGLSFIWS